MNQDSSNKEHRDQVVENAEHLDNDIAKLTDELAQIHERINQNTQRGNKNAENRLDVSSFLPCFSPLIPSLQFLNQSDTP